MSRYSRRILFVFLAFISLVAVGFAYHTFTKPDGPRLSAPSCVLDLGEGKPGELLTGSFDLRNTGNRELSFSLVAGCSCAHLEPRLGTIPPGGSVSIQVGVRLRDPGSRERIRIAIQSNDAKTPEAECSVTAMCPAPFDVTPMFVDFGTVAKGQTPTAVVRVRGPSGNPIDPSAGLRFAVSNEQVVVEEMEYDGEARQFNVRLRSNVPTGHLQTVMTFRLAGVESPIQIPVAATVVGLVQTAPQSLVISAGHEGKVIVWRTDGLPLGKLERIESPVGFAAEEITDPSAVRRVIRVRSIGPAHPQGELSLRLKFATIPDEVVIAVNVDHSK